MTFGETARAIPADLVKHLLLGGSAGIGGVLAYMLVRSLSSEPQMLIAMVMQFGPWFVIVGACLAILDRRFAQLGEATVQSATAQQSLADAVRDATSRDSERAQKQDLVIGNMARQQDKTLEQLGEVSEKLDRVLSRGMSAAASG